VIHHRDHLYIGGDWLRPRTDSRIAVVSPNTEQEIGSIPEARPQDVDLAVEAARAALPGWSDTAPGERAALLRRFADAIEERAREIARTVSAQNGMPIRLSSQLEATYPTTLLRYYAAMIDSEPEDVRAGLLGGRIRVERDPIGVVAAITPWNFPQTLAAFKYAPALAAGCTVVMKPSPETALDAYLIAEAAAAGGLPAGVINIVPGGRRTGAYLVEHRGVDKVGFTGSTTAGRQIARTCGELLRPVTLELGGKSATIVLDDADLDLSVIGDELFVATLANNGQTCFLGTRVLAPRHRYEEVVDVFTAFAETLTIGDSLDPGTDIGPMVTERHRERVEGYIEKGRAEGGRVTTGGGRPDRPGWFVRPTVFADIDNAATISREEIFGPVLSIIAYDGDEDAVRIANDSGFGLGGTVWTADPERGFAVARKVRTGTFGMNRYLPDPVAPFGGVKDSGLGRELGPEGIAAYRSLKSIYC
jgi:NAD-dependent aldehyde dehydrogenases